MYRINYVEDKVKQKPVISVYNKCNLYWNPLSTVV